MNVPPEEDRVLVFLPEGDGSAPVRSFFEEAGLSCRICADVEAFGHALRAGAGAAVVAEEVLSPEAMRRLAGLLGEQEKWSDFPLVILFDANGYLPEAGLRLLDVLEPLGNVTVLQRPVHAAALVSVVRAALRARRRQTQVRDLLRQRARDALRRESFLRLIAHELRNSLGAVRNAVHILNRLGGPEAGPASAQRSLIERQTAHLAFFIEGILDLDQVVAGRVRLRPELVDLEELAGRSLKAVAWLADSKRVRLALLPGDPGPALRADPQRLEQAFTHLLTNLVHESAARGTVAMSLGREEDTAVVRFRDGAPPLDLGSLPQVHDPLLGEADAPPIPEEDLPRGLALVGGLVRLQGGTFTVIPGNDEAGNEFVIRLPGIPETHAVGPTSTTRPSAAAGPRRVLVVEDDADGRESLGLLIQLWGHRVETEATGTRAVQNARRTAPDVALVDIGLPGLDGYQVARQLREVLGPQVFLVAMTGYGEPHDRQRALDAGFDSFLIKPVVPATLQILLDKVPWTQTA